jgi:hypothetical protein
MVADWKNYKPTDEQIEYAEEVGEKLTEPEDKQAIRLVRGGRKKTPDYGSANLPPLTGCTKEQSDIIRELIGLKYAGFTQREAFEKTEINPRSAISLFKRSEVAVQEAHQELMERCLKALHYNSVILRSALSEMGPRAVRVLGEVMDDKDSSAAARVNAAKIVLKMANADGSVVADDGPSGFLVTLKDNRTGIESDSVIIDAEDVEVLSDDDTDECSAGIC